MPSTIAPISGRSSHTRTASGAAPAGTSIRATAVSLRFDTASSTGRAVSSRRRPRGGGFDGIEEYGRSFSAPGRTERRRGGAGVTTGAALAVIPPISPGVIADPEWIGPFAREAERLGFESLVLPEHVALSVGATSRYPYSPTGTFPLPLDCAIPDPLAMLAYVAAVTTTLGLATGLLVLPLHDPLQLAKHAATVDRLSKGRLRLGVGLGWFREEIEAGGVDFATRGERADEIIDALPRPLDVPAHHRRPLRRSALLLRWRAVLSPTGPARGGAHRGRRYEPRRHPARCTARRRMAGTGRRGEGARRRARAARSGGQGRGSHTFGYRRDPERRHHCGHRRSRRP